MKASEKKEIAQTFDLERQEVTDAILSYLKAKGVVVPDKATFSFEIKLNPTSRDIESFKIMTKFSEENPCNGHKK